MLTKHQQKVIMQAIEDKRIIMSARMMQGYRKVCRCTGNKTCESAIKFAIEYLEEGEDLKAQAALNGQIVIDVYKTQYSVEEGRYVRVFDHSTIEKVRVIPW